MEEKKQYVEAEFILTLPIIEKGGSVYMLIPATMNKSMGLRGGDTVQLGLTKIVARVKPNVTGEAGEN